MYPIGVWDACGDYYYVCAGAVDSGRGFAYPQPALLLKEDYWQGRENYIWVTLE